MKSPRTLIVIASVATFLCSASFAFAHAVVSPKQATVAAYQEFSLAVPSEKPQATTAVRLLIPGNMKNVRPNVAPGWQVSVKTDAQSGLVTEIDWNGGTIPAGQRNDFVFQAQTPASATTLDWKAYQTYADGSIVSWDQAPTEMTGDNDFSSTGPYSTTTIVNDLQQPTPVQPTTNLISQEIGAIHFAFYASIAALILAIYAVVVGSRKNNRS